MFNSKKRSISIKSLKTHLKLRKNRELVTTETEDKAIAAAAIHGWIWIPSGWNTPAAIGIPREL